MSAAADSFDEFVAARYPALLRTAYLMVGNRADAEDLLQSALMRCVPKWKRIASNPEPYVRKVIAHESVSRWRRRRWRETSIEQLPEVGVAAREGSVDLRRSLAELPPRQRTAVVLRHYLELSEAETAEAMGCSVGTVKSQTHAGLAKLRSLMGDAPITDSKAKAVPQ